MADARRRRADGSAPRRASPRSPPPGSRSATARRVVALVGAGQQRRRRAVCRGPPRRAPAATPSRCTHEHGPRGGPRAAAEAAGGRAHRRRPGRAAWPRPTSCSTASSASAAGPACRRGAAGSLAAIPDDGPRPRRRPPLRVRTRRGERRPRRRVRRRDRHLRRSPSRCTCCPPPSRPVRRLTVVDIGLDLDGDPAACERLDLDDVAALLARAGRERRQVLPRRARRRRRVASRTPARRCSACTAAVEAGLRHGALRRHPDADRPRRAAVPEAVTATAGCRPGSSGRGSTPRQGRRAPGAARRGPRGAREREPVVVDAGGLDLLDAGCSTAGRTPSPSSPRTPASSPAC